MSKISLYDKLLLKVRILPLFRKGWLQNAKHTTWISRYSSGTPHRWTYTINMKGHQRMFFVLSVLPKQSKRIYEFFQSLKYTKQGNLTKESLQRYNEFKI